jgi:hypothetical protein
MFVTLMYVIEQVGSGGNTSDVYSGGIRLESQLVHLLQQVSCCFPSVSAGKCWDSNLRKAKTGSFQILSYLSFINSPNIWHYIA